MACASGSATTWIRITVSTDSSQPSRVRLLSIRFRTIAVQHTKVQGCCIRSGGSKGNLKMQNKILRLIERWLLALGMFLLAVYVGAVLHASIASRFALLQFQKAQAAELQSGASTPVKSESEDGIDFRLWADKRIQGYRESLSLKKDLPVAVLRIDKLGIEVPVFNGTDDLTLNRGVGRIIGTARPGGPGNIGIAGHRDGFFRGLKDISVGDQVDLMMTTTRTAYVVDEIEIVTPDDVRVLQPRSVPALTLVTCYPFYFVGDAPNRFIVHASLASTRNNIQEDTR